jgi:hypothetical protein
VRVELAVRIAPIVLTNITTRYPYHDAHLFRDGETPIDPTAAHPAFGNSFDWHSSVHSHWTAMQLLAYFAACDDEPAVAGNLLGAVATNLTVDNIAAEAAYLAARPAYERPYGWAWALMLAAEADASDVVALHPIRAPLRSLAQQVAASAVRWLDTLPAPIRHGVHGNTAFALGLMFDAAETLKFTELERAIREHALAWFQDDRDYPAAWERSGYDFLSPGLAQADLMRRVLRLGAFSSWWSAFLPDASADSSIFAVADVPNVSDGQIAHLHGLNLSRAGALARIALALRGGQDGASETGAQTVRLSDHAQRLYNAGVAAAVGGDYFSTHWLPTFAWDAASSIDESLAAPR